MTKEEENNALLAAWDKITEWTRENCRFPETMKFRLPHEVYHWSTFEVYPSGDCAVLTGSHGNPGEHRPTMVHGREQFGFSMADGCRSWRSKEEDFDACRNSRSVDYCKTVNAFYLLRELYDNWSYVKQQIVGAANANAKLKGFEP